MKLSDFSPLLKERAVQKGSVFKMKLFPSDGVVPKNEGDTSRDKYLVILGIDAEKILVGFLLINTNINKNLNVIIKPYQHRILSSNYAFLCGHDRYVDCYEIKETSFERLVQCAEYIGNINSDDFNAICQKINISPVIKPYTLKRFGVYQE